MEDVYVRLMGRMDEFPLGAPESGNLLELLRMIFDEEQAELALEPARLTRWRWTSSPPGWDGTAPRWRRCWSAWPTTGWSSPGRSAAINITTCYLCCPASSRCSS